MIERRPTRWLTGSLAFAAGIAAVCPAHAQAAAAGLQPLPPLPIVRLDGAPDVAGPVQIPRSSETVPPAAMPVGRLDDPSATALDGAATVSLAISRPMPLGDLLQLLVDGTSLSLVLDDEVTGSFKGSLKELTLRQAIEAVLFPRSLDYDVQGNLIRVYPRRPRTRLFDVNYLNVRRTWQRGVHGTTGIPGVGPGSVSLTSSSTAAMTPLDELERGVASLLSGSGRVHVDRSAGLVQVTDFADRIEQVAAYVAALETRASRQVRIEARVFEITLRDASAAAIDWNAAAARAGVRVDARAAGMRVTDFAALTRALEEQGTVRTIAAPRVVAMNNEPAVMTAGSQDVYFVAASQLAAAGGTDHRTVTPATVLDGLSLTVTAQIAADGHIQLNVAPSYAEQTGQRKSSRGDTAPVLSVIESDTTVRVRDGDTVIIAGLLRDRPRTTQATGISGFFGAQTHATVKSELVILLTPTVVTPGPPTAAGGR